MKPKPPPLNRYAEIVANLRPLAEFYRKHKPEVQTIRLFDADYQTLAKYPKKAARFGFLLHGKQIKFAEFTLLSETQNG